MSDSAAIRRGGEVPSEGSEPDAGDAPLRSPRVLVVDDVRANLVAIKRVLSKVDAELVLCESADEALRATLHADFALAILDVRMPEIDGFELARLILGAHRTRELPIIFLSAEQTELQHVHRGYAAGAFDYLVKPYAAEILVGKVQAFLRIYAQHHQIERLNDKLERSNRALRRHEEALEALVAERTSQLAQQVERLAEEIVQRQALETRLERAHHELQQMAYCAAHDLKGPVRTIGGLAGLIAEEARSATAEEIIMLSRRIGGVAQRMSTLIDDVLALSLPPRRPIERVVVDLEGLVREVVEVLMAGGAAAEVQIGALPTVTGHPTQLRRLARNLIENCLRHPHPRRPLVVQIDAEPDAEGWRITLRDNGIGFSEDEARCFFEPQLRPRRSARINDSGVNLTLCRKIAEHHGGRIEVCSENGEGALFTLVLPGR